MSVNGIPGLTRRSDKSNDIHICLHYERFLRAGRVWISDFREPRYTA